MPDCPAPVPRPLASALATPLERQFGRIAGVTQMTSSSTLGGSNITLQFDLNRNIDGAARDVQAAINAARAQLPANLPQNPQLLQIQSGRRADHDPGAHLRPVEPAADLRRRRLRPAAEDLPGAGRGRELRRRRRQSGGSRRSQPDAAQLLWHRPRVPAHHARRRQPEHGHRLLPE